MAPPQSSQPQRARPGLHRSDGAGRRRRRRLAPSSFAMAMAVAAVGMGWAMRGVEAGQCVFRQVRWWVGGRVVWLAAWLAAAAD